MLSMFALLSLSGCQKLGGLGGLQDVLAPYMPTLSYERISLEEIDFQHAEADLVFSINNPNPVQISLASLTYQLDLEGQRALSGNQDGGLQLAAEGSSEMSIPVSLTFADVADLLNATKGKDKLNFNLGGEMGFDTPVGVGKLPYSASGDFPVVRAPSVKLSKLRLKELAILENRASLALDLDVTNDGGSSISLANFDYNLSLEGSKVASGAAAALGAVAGQSTNTVTLPIDLNLLNLGSSALSLIKSKGDIQVGLDASTSVETPFGSLPLSIDKNKKLSLQ